MATLVVSLCMSQAAVMRDSLSRPYAIAGLSDSDPVLDDPIQVGWGKRLEQTSIELLGHCIIDIARKHHDNVNSGGERVCSQE
jgi:hypothetical protein